MSNESQLLEDILVSQVLLLADKIKANKLQLVAEECRR